MAEARVTGIGQVFVPVQDIDRAVAFYGGALGLELLLRPPGRPMAFLRVGDTRLYLDGHPSEDERRSPLVYYRVASLDDAVEALREAGAEIVSESHVVHRDATGELWVAVAYDTEGNMVALMAERDAGTVEGAP